LGKDANQLKITYTITIKMVVNSQEYKNKQILKHSNLNICCKLRNPFLYY